MTQANTHELPVAVRISGSLPNLQWQASPDPLDVSDENLIVYQLTNLSGSPLAFCAVDISPTNAQFSVQSIAADRVEVLDQDSSPGVYEVYLWVQDSSGNRYRSPDPQVINRPK